MAINIPLPALLGATTLPQAYMAAMQQRHQQALMPLVEHLKSVESQYAQQNAVAKLKEMLAHTGYMGAETAAIPQRIGLERGRLGVEQGNLGLRGQELALNNLIKNMQYNPEKQAAELERIQSETAKNKAMADKAGIALGIGAGPSAQGGPLSYYTPANRTEAQKQYDTAQQLLKHIDDLKKYGTEGTHGLGFSGSPAYTWAHTDTGNKAKYQGTLAQSQDKFVSLQKLRPTNYTLKTAEKTMGRAPYESPEDYKQRLDDFASSVQDRVGQLGQYLGKGGLPLTSSGQIDSIPEWKTKEDFLNWKKTATPQQIALAKSKHGI